MGVGEQGKISSKKDQTLAEQTPSPVVPHLAAETCDGFISVPKGSGNPDTSVFLRITHSLSLGRAPVCAAFLGGQAMILTYLVSRALHCNLGVTFTVSCSDLSGPLGKDSDSARYCLASGGQAGRGHTAPWYSRLLYAKIHTNRAASDCVGWIQAPLPETYVLLHV